MNVPNDLRLFLLGQKSEPTEKCTRGLYLAGRKSIPKKIKSKRPFEAKEPEHIGKIAI